MNPSPTNLINPYKGFIVIIADISKAFDRVNTGKLIELLIDNTFPEGVVTWIHEYLKRREIIINTTDGQERITTTQ